MKLRQLFFLTLFVFPAAEAAVSIEVYFDLHILRNVTWDAARVYAESDTLGWGEASIAQGYNFGNVWVIPNTADKDERVSYKYVTWSGETKWLDICATSGSSAKSVDYRVTAVTLNGTDCSLSYRYKGWPKYPPKVIFKNGTISGATGTNIVHGVGSAHIPWGNVNRFEWNSDRCGWNEATTCFDYGFYFTIYGGVKFNIPAPSNDLGQLSVLVNNADGSQSRYYFNVSEWTNGSGVTKVGDRFQLGTYELGSISCSGGTVTIDMGYDWYLDVPETASGITGHLMGGSVGWTGSGIVSGESLDAQGHKVFYFGGVKSGETMALRINDSAGIEYWPPITDFVAGPGVASITEGGFACQ